MWHAAGQRRSKRGKGEDRLPKREQLPRSNRTGPQPTPGYCSCRKKETTRHSKSWGGSPYGKVTKGEEDTFREQKQKMRRQRLLEARGASGHEGKRKAIATVGEVPHQGKKQKQHTVVLVSSEEDTPEGAETQGEAGLGEDRTCPVQQQSFSSPAMTVSRGADSTNKHGPSESTNAAERTLGESLQCSTQNATPEGSSLI